MKVSREYSFLEGSKFIRQKHAGLMKDIYDIIAAINIESCRIEEPSNKDILRAKRFGTERFFSRSHLIALFNWHLFKQDWDLKPRIITSEPTRENYRKIDAVKQDIGLALQFRRHPLLTYDVIGNLVTARNAGLIKAGVEICFMASMLPDLPSGVGTYEQVVWDLWSRGDCSIDTPVVIIGIETDEIFRLRLQAQRWDSRKTVSYLPMRVERERFSQLPQATLRKVRETGIDI